jgi:cytosine/creatinine deaminase
MRSQRIPDFFMLFDSPHYWLRNAQVPASLLVDGAKWKARKILLDNLLLVDIEVRDGSIATMTAAETFSTFSAPSIDLRRGMVLPCFVDLHTHLDKGHIWQRATNPDGTFESAIATVQKDARKYWTAEDLYRRMEFGLKCSYAHGTKAIRTHLDAAGKLAELSFGVFQELQQQWRDRIQLQAVCLVSLDYYLTPAREKLADFVASVDGILGGVAYENPALEAQIDATFKLAKQRKLSLDFHVDENGDPNSRCLDAIAAATIRHRYKGKVVCGHCCSLSVQPEEQVQATIALVKKAGIGIVSLPMCNLYLQDRRTGQTPYWRGITQLHELRKAGIPVAISSDNCRDPFYGFGDHDGLEVFTQAVRIAHLDRPYGDWINAITATPAELMNCPETGRIGVDFPADLILFKARNYSELLSRRQSDRIVLRAGKAIDPHLPDYSELDDLFPAGAIG